MLQHPGEPAPGTITIEVDHIGPPDHVLVTLMTGRWDGAPPGRSFVALGDRVELQELPELLRLVGLQLVYGDCVEAHRVVWRHLRELAERA